MSRSEHFASGAGVHIEHVTDAPDPYIAAKVGDQEVGSLDYWELHGKPGVLGVSDVTVSPAHQRRGVATAMYDHLLTKVHPKAVIHHDVPNMSPDGRALGAKLAQRHPGRHVFTEM